jgi:hypothetical protein
MHVSGGIQTHDRSVQAAKIHTLDLEVTAMYKPIIRSVKQHCKCDALTLWQKHYVVYNEAI